MQSNLKNLPEIVTDDDDIIYEFEMNCDVPKRKSLKNETCNISEKTLEEFDPSGLSKIELLEKCEELGIKKCKSKNKGELINLIQNKLYGTKSAEETIIENDNANELVQLKHLKPLIKWSGGKSD
jgi:hypothetical protein